MSVTWGSTEHDGDLASLFQGEWGAIELYGPSDAELAVPTPLKLLYKDELAGGLAFTAFPSPGGDPWALWINALLIVPRYRRRGYASLLIQHAEQEASSLLHKTLFVQTEYPALYAQLGWQSCSQHGHNTVLSKTLDA